MKYPTYAAVVAAMRRATYTKLRTPVRAYRCKSHYHITGNA